MATHTPRKQGTGGRATTSTATSPPRVMRNCFVGGRYGFALPGAPALLHVPVDTVVTRTRGDASDAAHRASAMKRTTPTLDT
jgi:hypothetical protein